MIPIISDTDLIPMREVERTVGLKKSSIYDRIKKGEFPKPKKLGSHAARWVRGEIEDWKQQWL